LASFCSRGGGGFRTGFVLRNRFGGARGLEFVEIGFGAAHAVLGGGAGAVDGVLGGQEFGVVHGIDGGMVGVRHSVFEDLCAFGLRAKSFFGHGAAAETPRAADEFGGGDFFNGAEGCEFGPEAGAEAVVFFAFVGLDAVIG